MNASNGNLDPDMHLGLHGGENRLVPYDSAWPTLYQHEEARLRDHLHNAIVAIEHYGSTAVPGMKAKPIIDILVGVDKPDKWSLCKKPLEGLGYDYAENAGVPGHHIFGRPQGRQFLVHIVEWKSDY
jgi:GrpB-like predicted nucleotidyltransferase (UPF0157 family)